MLSQSERASRSHAKTGLYFINCILTFFPIFIFFFATLNKFLQTSILFVADDLYVCFCYRPFCLLNLGLAPSFFVGLSLLCAKESFCRAWGVEMLDNKNRMTFHIVFKNCHCFCSGPLKR